MARLMLHSLSPSRRIKRDAGMNRPISSILAAAATTTTTHIPCYYSVSDVSNNIPLRIFLFMNANSIILCSQRNLHQFVSRKQWLSTSSTTTSTTKTKAAATTTTSSTSGGSIAMPNQDVELRLADLQTKIQQHYQRGDYIQALKVSKDLVTIDTIVNNLLNLNQARVLDCN
jgi:hypothetical protein